MWKLIFVFVVQSGDNSFASRPITIVTDLKTKDGCVFMQKHLAEKLEGTGHQVKLSTCVKAE